MEKQGLMHIYHGDGKGKTTASLGLCVRARGRGFRVMLVQFLKGQQTGELEPLRQLGVEIVRADDFKKFLHQMTLEEQRKNMQSNDACFDAVLKGLQDETLDLLVMDEVLDAAFLETIDEKKLIEAIDNRPKGQEIVLTGRRPSKEMLERADYITEMVVKKHPYQQGIAARIGIEF